MSPELDCETCEYKFPGLWGENADVWQLWKSARNQWHTGFDGPVRLDYCAVETIAKRLEIDITPCMLRKLEALEAYMLDYWRRKRDENGKRH